LQKARLILRWGGLALALIGFWLQRTGQTSNAAETGRIVIWAGLTMIVAALFVRLFAADARGAKP